MGIGNQSPLSERLALFSPATILGVVVVAVAVLGEENLERVPTFWVLGTGAAIFAYSAVEALRARRRDRAVTALVLLCATAVLPFLRIWYCETLVFRIPRTLFEENPMDFE
jgi:hypothetical protein